MKGIDGACVVVSCEHGGNRIPSRYLPRFRGWQRVLSTHRGYDSGALALARELAEALSAALVTSTVSRLLVDLNRSLSNPHVWSEATRALSSVERERIVRRHYAPYRDRMFALVAEAVAAGRRVIHVSSHSFTPVLDGDVRTADIGLLYDPARAPEAAMAARWKTAFAECAPQLRVRRNYPYAGKNDGLTSSLRRRFPAKYYIGMEIEVNQAFVLAGGPAWRHVRAAVVAAAQAALR